MVLRPAIFIIAGLSKFPFGWQHARLRCDSSEVGRYVGGQNAVDGSGAVVGKGDIATQTDQAVKNVLSVVEAAGGTIESLLRSRRLPY